MTKASTMGGGTRNRTQPGRTSPPSDIRRLCLKKSVWTSKRMKNQPAFHEANRIARYEVFVGATFWTIKPNQRQKSRVQRTHIKPSRPSLPTPYFPLAPTSFHETLSSGSHDRVNSISAPGVRPWRSTTFGVTKLDAPAC